MVYLIHLEEPYKHAQHYIGYTKNLQKRMYDHELGTRGSKFLKAVREAGINFSVVRTWDGDRSLERKLKKQKKSRLLCPICREKAKKEVNKGGKSRNELRR